MRDPIDEAARFWAQILGFEISYDGPPPGSVAWGMDLVTRLAEEAGRSEKEVDVVAKEYLRARWRYCYPELEELWGEPPYPPRTHQHRDD